MLTHEYSFRVMYSDTDRMGIVHHSNYPKYYETARWELFRSIGLSYDFVEKAGFMLPVIRMHYKFIKTANYDALLKVKTTLKNINGARIWFTYKLFNEHNDLINEAETELAFVRSKDWKPCIAPYFVLQAIAKNINREEIYV